MTTEPTAMATVPAEAVDNLLLPSPSEPLKVAELFLAMQCVHDDDALTLRFWRDGWWSWSGTCWRENGRNDIRAMLYEFTRDKHYIKHKPDGGLITPDWSPNQRRVNDLLDALKALCRLDDSINPGCWLDGRQTETVIACRNGLLDRKTRKLLPHTPLYFNLQALPFDYDAGAACPAWDDFMRDLWGDDDEPPMALEEMMGCAVAGKLDLQRILVLVGPRRGGKSLIARIFEALVGPANTSWVSLMGLTDDSTLSSLIGKSLCINGDIRATGRKGPEIAERLLRISGGDSFTINRKYKEAWTGPLPALIVQVSNELPTIRDAGGALAGRYLPLILTKSWEGQEDRTLPDKLMAELPGILNRALEGLDAVESSGRFTEPKASREVTWELADMASPMLRFVNERVAVMPLGGERDDYRVETGVLLAAYNRWAIENHEEQIDKARLGQRLHAVVPQLRRSQPRGAEGERTSSYSGIRLLHGESPSQAAFSKLSLRTGHSVHVIEGGEGGG